MHPKEAKVTDHTHTATQTPRALCGSILPVIIVSVALNILLMVVLLLVMIVFIIKARRKTGTNFAA